MWKIYSVYSVTILQNGLWFEMSTQIPPPPIFLQFLSGFRQPPDMIEWPAKLLTTIHPPHKRATTRSCSTIEYNTDYIPPLPLGLGYLCRFTIHTTFILQTYTFYNVAAPHLHSLQGLLHTYTVLNVAYQHLHCMQCDWFTLTQSTMWLVHTYTK